MIFNCYLGSNSAVTLTISQSFAINPLLSSIAQSKFFQPRENTKMDIESPVVRTQGDGKKVSQSAGQTKKRKLSNKNLKLNSEGLCRKFDPFFDCFTPKLEEHRILSENAKTERLISQKISEEFVVLEVFGIFEFKMRTFLLENRKRQV